MLGNSNRNWVSIAIQGTAALFLLFHLLFPKLRIDGTTLGLFAIIILPWLKEIVKSIKVGDMEVEFRELQKIREDMSAAGLLGNPPKQEEMPLYISVANDDPKLAIVGLRFEIEAKVKAIAKAKGFEEAMPFLWLIKKLLDSATIDKDQYNVLSRIRVLLNSAAHGVEIDQRKFDWALEIGPKLLSALDELMVGLNGK